MLCAGFAAHAASSLMASATAAGGTGSAILAALALLAGVAASDGALVLAGGLGLRRAGAGNLDIGRQVRRVLAILLGVVGASLVINGVLS